ncbi:MAG: rhomboid family intramembrane serine protease [Brevibacterium sp.]|uniref:rhomboid family intramembrane serine protease n=1 Tax=Brevibacterium sp. TaxID=1701 RepID=UPI0026472033|nr:rhomboid family intramembrane serine protease [Brevibacterium sp.]MDN5807429.1 rhomboid family intramembrane serine protease [Brevibacterium sp.]MDN5834498.1 rhomboid family intramembrane serine protease [Brevibacterium sp.]MDN5876581.1 rhomboid family intramembrane serine protease [Brevibacterium sp.]MDN5908931.1 rhomboid family intramembrane serine protease [Brevibacterium sp.]MDN6133895.1 rhomboid family intramembrane serine protease [Brevibacterium sp.]
MDTPQEGSARETGRALSVSPPLITRTIMILTGVVFLAQLLPGLDLVHRLSFVPALVLEQPWRVLTVALVHAQPSPFHLLANMIGLFFFGTFVERALGHWRFLILYMLGTIGGSVMVLVLAKPFSLDWVTNNIGASGAVFAIIGVLLVPTRRLDRNITGVVLFVVLNFGYGLLVAGVSWQAHLGGLIAGFVLGCGALLVPKKQSTLVFGLAALGLLLAMLAVGAWRINDAWKIAAV